jgi:predicted Zn-dependent protease
MKKNMGLLTSLTIKLIVSLIFLSACTKTRQAELPEDSQDNIIPISEFGSLGTTTNFSVYSSNQVQVLSEVSSASALNENQSFKIDQGKLNIPAKLRFMFKDLFVHANGSEELKIVFSVDGRSVTAYKLVSANQKISTLEKQLALTVDEVRNSVLMKQNTKTVDKMAEMKKKLNSLKLQRRKAVEVNQTQNLLIPLFKYDVQAKGILQRTKNELKEQTSTLQLKETEFEQATHIKISTKSEDRKDIGSYEQYKELSQLYTASKIENKVYAQSALASELNIQINGKFKNSDSDVLTKLDSDDLKLYEIMKSEDLTSEQQRFLKAGSAQSEIMTCAAAKITSAKIKENCVVVLRAKVPVTYKSAKLSLVNAFGQATHEIELEDVAKKDSMGLVYIAKKAIAETVQSTGAIDPENTFKLSDLSGEFFFRRTVEDASNSFLGEIGTSSDTYITRFELGEKRIVVRSTETLSQHYGQGAKDREEIMSFEAAYFKMQKTNASGSKLTVPVLTKSTLQEAEYVQINWLKNAIPDSSSPMAFYQFGSCLEKTANEEISDARNDLAAGTLNFSILSSLNVKPECAARIDTNAYSFWNTSQFNFTVKERISFKKHVNKEADQVLSNIAPQTQNALNFNGITLAQVDTKSPNSYDLRKVDSQTYKVAQHDFRNGKKLIYHIGGLQNADPSRKEILKKVSIDVAKDWNDTFRKAFKGTSLERATDYVEIQFDGDDNKGNLGDLDRSYIWYFDLPFENGALGVAQPAINPRSGQIVSANVLMYPGNMADQLKSFYGSAKKQREYEVLLEEIKKEKTKEILEKWDELDKKSQIDSGKNEIAAAEKKAAKESVVQSTTQDKKVQSAVLQKILLKNRLVKPVLMSSKFDGLKYKYLMQKSKTGAIKTKISNRVFRKLKDINQDVFSKRLIEKIFKEDIQKDPLVMEKMIAQEFLSSDPNLTAEARILLQNKIQVNQMKENFNKNFKARFGCKIDSSLLNLGVATDSFLNESFEKSFEGIMKWVLAHEMGHAFGLIHNFKGSFDKENFAYEGETTDRTYASVMDYIAYSQSPYRGLGTYDVHAIRAIYTQQIEISKALQSPENMQEQIKKMTADGQITASQVGATTAAYNKLYQKLHSYKLNQGKYIQIADAVKAMEFPAENYMTKETVSKTNMLRFFHQCNDYEQYTDIRCTPYDWGSSAVNIVKYLARQYDSSYAAAYHIGDRIHFGWEQKINLIRRTISDFREIRAFLDLTIEMLMGKARNQEEISDFVNASIEGYRFFNNLIRIPDTDLGLVSSSNKDEYKKNLVERLYPLLSKNEIYEEDENGDPVVGEDGSPVVKSVEKKIDFVEARRVYDKRIPGDKIDTIGIGYDKSFALEFLLMSSSTGIGDDSQMGYISYLDFEKLATQNDASPENSTVIKTISSILSGHLAVSLFTEDGNFVTTENEDTIKTTAEVTAALNEKGVAKLPSIKMNQFLLDGAIDGSTFSLNETRQRGFDAFAEYFKVGRSEGGLILNDRTSVRKANVGSSSQSGVRYWAGDNAGGAAKLIDSAALLEKMLDHSGEIAAGVAATYLYFEDVTKMMKDPSKANEVEAAKKKYFDALGSLTKLLVLKLNADGQFNGIAGASPEKAMLQMSQLLINNTDTTFTQLKGFVEKINQANMTAVEISEILQGQTSFKALLQRQVDNDPTAAITQKATLELLQAENITMKASDIEEPVAAADLLMATLVTPDDYLKANIDEQVGIIKDISDRSVLINPEYKR